MRKVTYFTSLFFVVMAILLFISATFTYTSRAADSPKSEEIARFNNAVRHGSPILVGFYSPT